MSATTPATQGARLLADVGDAQVYHSTWRDLLDVVPECDALIVDAPYSERTHAGHDDGAEAANEAAVAKPDVRGNKRRLDIGLRAIRRHITYRPWTTADVRAFVAEWSPRVRGWFVSITDHALAPAWEAALETAGRYVFAPLPFVAPGSRVRLLGDGPSMWTCWIVVGRPRSRAFVETCRTLSGAYVLPSGQGGAMPVVGGKPIWLGCSLVRDYSRPGDLIVDPCAGAGTFGVAALREGRRAIVGDALLAHAELAAQWVKHPHRPAPSGREERAPAGQASLFAGVSK